MPPPAGSIPPPTWDPPGLPLFHPWRRSARAYRQLRLGLRGYLRTAHQLRIEAEDLVPLEGPLLVAGNHPSLLDPPCLLAALPRRTAVLAAEWTFSYPVLRRIMRGTGMIFVDRQKGGATALRQALRMLEQGWAIGIYPAGTLVADSEGRAVKEGLVQMAALSGASILPVRTFGTDVALPYGKTFPRPGRAVRIRFGPVFQPDIGRGDLKDPERVATVSQAIMDRIYAIE